MNPRWDFSASKRIPNVISRPISEILLKLNCQDCLQLLRLQRHRRSLTIWTLWLTILLLWNNPSAALVYLLSDAIWSIGAAFTLDANHHHYLLLIAGDTGSPFIHIVSIYPYSLADYVSLGIQIPMGLAYRGRRSLTNSESYIDVVISPMCPSQTDSRL